MRKLLVTLDDDLSKVLAEKPNQSEVVREALRLYNENITTGTLVGMRQSFVLLTKKLQDLEDRFTEQYDMVEKVHTIMTELGNR